MEGNKLGTMPISKLIWNMSLPIIVSMLVQALYNIVDSIFVAKYSQDALAAVSLVYPLQMLVVAIGVGTGVGVNSLIARRLGESGMMGRYFVYDLLSPLWALALSVMLMRKDDRVWR